MKKLWSLKNFLVKDLKDHPKNARQISREEISQLRRSIQNFGLIDKPVLDGKGMIIGGHQRVRVLKNLKIKSVDCWVPDEPLTDEEIDELNIRLNRNNGTWDYDILANNWDMSNLIKWGFTPYDFHIVEEKEEENDDDKDEEPSGNGGKDKESKKCPHCGNVL